MSALGERAVDKRQQHVLFYRKRLMRMRTLQWAASGAAYVPFIGDGDLASELYQDRYVCGADIDEKRVEVAAKRVTGDVVVADCDHWPFHGTTQKFAVGDFDAYAEPYASFRSFWVEADKTKRLVQS